MGQWCLLLLVASQAALWQSSVDATFDVGLRWLRGDTSLFFIVVNTTTTTETAPPLSTLADVNSTVTKGALNERRGNVTTTTTPTLPTPVDTTQFVGPTTTGVPPQESRSEPASSPATTGTTAGTVPSTTPLVIANATRVSLDDLALEIAKVPDPVLHLAQNEDGSPAYLVVSGRLGPTTETTTVATTTAATTTAGTTATTIPPPRNTTSVSYETLLSYLRPWIFGRLFPAPATPSAAGVEQNTTSPITAPAWTPGPAIASTTDSRMLTRAGLDIAGTSPTTTETGTHLPVDPTTLFPAEFRETAFGEDYALTEATGFNESSNAAVAGTDIPSTVQPATTADTATPFATDAAPTPRTASTRGVFVETSSAFPAQATTSSNVTSDDVTEAGIPATATRMSSQTDGTTATFVTTLQPPVGDMRDDTAVPATTTESPTSLPTVNQTSAGYDQSTWPLYTVEEQPAYRYYYDPSEVSL